MMIMLGLSHKSWMMIFCHRVTSSSWNHLIGSEPKGKSSRLNSVGDSVTKAYRFFQITEFYNIDNNCENIAIYSLNMYCSVRQMKITCMYIYI